MSNKIERVETECVIKGKGSDPSTVSGDGRGEVIGQLEKFNNTRSTTHPWKAYRGTGMNRVFLAAFYGPAGRADAIAAILATR
jgi:hypothetical protein